MKTQVNIKIDEKIKKAAQKRAKVLGLSLSSVINATLSEFARSGELHVKTEHRMTPYLERVVEQAQVEYEAGMANGPFTGEEFIVHLKEL